MILVQGIDVFLTVEAPIQNQLDLFDLEKIKVQQQLANGFDIVSVQ